MDTDDVKEKTQLVYKILHILTKSLPRKDVTQYHKTEQCTCNNLLAHFLLSVFCVSVEQERLGKEEGRGKDVGMGGGEKKWACAVITGRLCYTAYSAFGHLHLKLGDGGGGDWGG